MPTRSADSKNTQLICRAETSLSLLPPNACLPTSLACPLVVVVGQPLLRGSSRRHEVVQEGLHLGLPADQLTVLCLSIVQPGDETLASQLCRGPIVAPASIVRFVPVIYRASALAKNSTAWAMSCGCPAMFKGFGTAVFFDA